MVNLLGLIEMYNTYDHNSIFHSVATCLVKNYRLLDTMTSAEIAELCNVSPSTLDRFFRMMSYPMTVSKLPELASQTKDNYMFDGNYIPYISKGDEECSLNFYINSLKDRISSLYESVNKKQINNLVEDIKTCKKVVFLGCPIPHGVWRLQMDLVLRGIENCAFMDPNYQYEELDKIEEGSIVFYTQYARLGNNIFKKLILANKDKIKKFVVLTNNDEHPLSSFADYVFYYKGSGTEQDNILMNIYINLIAIVFRENYK